MQVTVRYRPFRRTLECVETSSGKLVSSISHRMKSEAIYLRNIQVIQERNFPFPRKIVVGEYVGVEGSKEGKEAWAQLYLNGKMARVRWHHYGPSRQLMAPSPNSPFSSGDLIRIGPDDGDWFPQAVVLNPR